MKTRRGVRSQIGVAALWQAVTQWKRPEIKESVTK